MRFNPTSPYLNPGRAATCPPGYTMINKNMQGYACVSTSAVPKPGRCPPGYSMTQLGHGKFTCTKTIGGSVKANPNGGACCGECAEHAANPCGGAPAMNPMYATPRMAPSSKCKPGYAWNAKTKKCEFQKIILQPSGDPLGNPTDVHSFLVRAWSQPRRVTAGPMMAPCAPGQFYSEDLNGCYWPAGSVKRSPTKPCPPGQTWTRDLGCVTIPPFSKFPSLPPAPRRCPPGMTWTQDLGCVFIPRRR